MKRWLPRFIWDSAAAAMPDDGSDADSVYIGLIWGHTYIELVVVRRGREWR